MCSTGSPTCSSLILQCLHFFVLVFVSLFSLFCLSFIRPKSHQDYSFMLLSSPQHSSKGMCVVVPSGLLCPYKPTALLPSPAPPPPPLQQRLRKPPPSLLFLPVVVILPCSTGNCWDILVFSSFPVTNQCLKSLFQLFPSLGVRGS